MLMDQSIMARYQLMLDGMVKESIPIRMETSTTDSGPVVGNMDGGTSRPTNIFTKVTGVMVCVTEEAFSLIISLANG
jgi:hypothetical protein